MDFLILRPLPPKTGYHFLGGWGGGGVGGGGQKFLLNRLQAVGTHDAGNTDSGPMVTQLVCRILAPPLAARQSGQTGARFADQLAAVACFTTGPGLGSDAGPPCCLGPHLPLTKNPNCVYLTDCLLAGSGTDWLTVNLSSRCTAEGNRIFLRVFGQSKIFSGAFGASQFRPKHFFGASNNSGSPGGGGGSPTHPPPLDRPCIPPLKQNSAL